MKIGYMVHPGFLNIDGEDHWLTDDRLIELYKIPKDRFVRTCGHCDFVLLSFSDKVQAYFGACNNSDYFVHLYPDIDNKYVLPKIECDCKKSIFNFKESIMKNITIYLIGAAVIFFGIMVFAKTSKAEEKEFTWNAPAVSADVSPPRGYFFHEGSKTGEYTKSIDVGNVLKYIHDVPRTDEDLFFNVSAYNNKGASAVNGEVLIEGKLPGVPTGLAVSDPN